MPRLSIDLDLIFTDHTLSREKALEQITSALQASAERLKERGFQTRIPVASDASETKLLVRRDNIEVKVEVNYMMRGTVYPVRMATLTSKAREVLLADLEIPVASLEDVYGSKLVAAMDRQHPRDLFDIMQLFAHGGITSAIRRAFVVYLIAHNRPIHEVLFPTPRDIAQEYEHTFKGMAEEPGTIAELLEARERMLNELQYGLNTEERRFLLSFVANRPDWPLLEISHLEKLPALRWKLKNLGQLQKSNAKKFAQQADTLAQLLM